MNPACERGSTERLFDIIHSSKIISAVGTSSSTSKMFALSVIPFNFELHAYARSLAYRVNIIFRY
jgi:hypothetical protein